MEVTPLEVALWTAGWTSAGWIVGHRLARTRDRENALRTQKVSTIPIFNKAIKDCGTCDPRVAWHQHKPEVENAALSFSVLLHGRRKRALDNAWAACDGTTDGELNTDDIRPAQKLLTSRLEAVLKIIESD
jgi:hypothetical protein